MFDLPIFLVRWGQFIFDLLLSFMKLNSAKSKDWNFDGKMRMKLGNRWLQDIYRDWMKKAIQLLTPDRLKVYSSFVLVLVLVRLTIAYWCSSGIVDVHGDVIGADFIAFYNGGKFFLDNKMDDLYNFAEQYKFQTNVTASPSYKAIHPFVNPPFSVLLFSPFSLGSYPSGLFFWWAGGFMLFIFSLYLLRQELEGLKVYSMPRLILCGFCFYPFTLWFFYGQNTTITFFLYTFFYVSLRKQRDGLAGLAVGLLIYKPQLGIALYLILLCKLRWKSLLTATISAGGCIAAGFAISTNAMIQFLKLSPTLTDMIRLYRETWDQPPISLSHLNDQIFNSHFNSILSYPTYGVHSLFGFSSLLFDNFSPTFANVVFFLLTVGVGAYFVYLAIKLEWEPRSRQWDLMLSVLFTLGLLLSPHLFAYDLMLLLLPLAIVVHCFPEGRNNRPLDGGVLLVWTVFLYLFCFVGTIFSKWQLEITQYLGFPEFALQINTIVILIWCFYVLYCIECKPLLSSEIPE